MSVFSEHHCQCVKQKEEKYLTERSFNRFTELQAAITFKI